MNLKVIRKLTRWWRITARNWGRKKVQRPAGIGEQKLEFKTPKVSKYFYSFANLMSTTK